MGIDFSTYPINVKVADNGIVQIQDTAEGHCASTSQIADIDIRKCITNLCKLDYQYITQFPNDYDETTLGTKCESRDSNAPRVPAGNDGWPASEGEMICDLVVDAPYVECVKDMQSVEDFRRQRNTRVQKVLKSAIKNGVDGFFRLPSWLRGE